MSKEALTRRKPEARNEIPGGHGRERTIGGLREFVSEPSINRKLNLDGITLMSFATSHRNASREVTDSPCVPQQASKDATGCPAC